MDHTSPGQNRGHGQSTNKHPLPLLTLTLGGAPSAGSWTESWSLLLEATLPSPHARAGSSSGPLEPLLCSLCPLWEPEPSEEPPGPWLNGALILSTHLPERTPCCPGQTRLAFPESSSLLFMPFFTTRDPTVLKTPKIFTQLLFKFQRPVLVEH